LLVGASTHHLALAGPAPDPAPPVATAQPATVTGPYFGQKPPGRTPEVFAPGVFWLPNRRVTRSAFSPDGTECFFGVPNASFSQVQLYYMRRVDNVWTSPVLAPFSVTDHTYRQPYYSADGRKLYFSSDKNGSSDLWMVSRTAQGWDEPQVLPAPINTSSYEGQYSQTKDGTAFFESDRPGGQGKFDIWRIDPPQSGQPPRVENLGPIVNSSADEGDPMVSPDGAYLLFMSNRPGCIGGSDLYVSFPDGKGGWTAPANLNAFIPGINTEVDEYGPTISPEGRYLFFVRLYHDGRRDGVYWVENPLSERKANSPK
jgi:Tol biopolymer transport system component